MLYVVCILSEQGETVHHCVCVCVCECVYGHSWLPNGQWVQSEEMLCLSPADMSWLLTNAQH